MRNQLAALSLFAALAQPVCAAAVAEDIPVYELGTIRHDSYSVIKHMWTQTWRSAFYLPSFPNMAAAVTAMKREALAVGAEAITNVICLPNEGWFEKRGTVYCHGQLIRLKSAEKHASST